MNTYYFKDVHQFADDFATHTDSTNLPSTNSLEQNVELLANQYQNVIEPGHGLFFDFKATPEYEKPVLDYLCKNFGWILEKPFFIRKPDHPNN